MEELINFDCPQCGQNIDADAAVVGMTITCPTCEYEITILPDTEAGADEPATEEPESAPQEDAIGEAEGHPEAEEESGDGEGDNDSDDDADSGDEDSEGDDEEWEEEYEEDEEGWDQTAPRPKSSSGSTTLRKRCHACGALCDLEVMICVNCGFNFKTRKSATAVDHDSHLDTAEELLPRLGFQLTDKGRFEMPLGSRDTSQAEFLDQLNAGIYEAQALRAEFKNIQPLADQEFDPLDTPVPNHFSLAILFDGEQLGDDFGKILMLTLLRRVEPKTLKQKVVAHVGNMIGFQNLYAIVVRGQIAKDMVTIANQFSSDFHDYGVLPYMLRFVTASKKDANRIQRTFSLPAECSLVRGEMQPDPKGRVARKFDLTDLIGTAWKLAL